MPSELSQNLGVKLRVGSFQEEKEEEEEEFFF